MRVVLDTNILVSALISKSGPTDRLYSAWKDHRYALVTSNEQLEEFRRVTRYPRVKTCLIQGPSARCTTNYAHRKSS
jgi:putative PIN family toxin of toxin-antitoxin system